MKISRPLSILLCVLIISFSLIVSVSASDNLIDPNVMNWSSTSDSTFNEVWSNGEVSYIKVYPESTDLGNLLVKSYTFYDLSNLKAGRSYTFSFHLLNLDEACRLDNTIIWDNYYGGFANGGFYVIGLGSWDSASNTVTAVEGSCVTINSSNFASLYGTDIDISFEFNNLVNPCIFIYYGEMSEYPSTQCLLVSNLQLIDNDSAEEDGFFKRLFEWFENKISGPSNSIKSFFIDLGNSLNSKFDNLVSGPGDSISSFFTKLGNLILYASWTDTPPENPFNSQDKPMSDLSSRLKVISDSFASSGENFENVIDSITGPVYLLDEFTKEFGWILGILVFTLSVIVIARFIGL